MANHILNLKDYWQKPSSNEVEKIKIYLPSSIDPHLTKPDFTKWIHIWSEILNPEEIDLFIMDFRAIDHAWQVELVANSGQAIMANFYHSGKVMLQGTPNLIDILLQRIETFLSQSKPQTKGKNQKQNQITVPVIGTDEAGKGDLFGPLVIGGVLITKQENLSKLQTLGVMDSKKMTDATILKLAQKIKPFVSEHLLVLHPAKYNELFVKFANLNKLLGWSHALVITELVSQVKTDPQDNLSLSKIHLQVLVDQFSSVKARLEIPLEKRLNQIGWTTGSSVAGSYQPLSLTQATKGERFLPVAAASIIARARFLQELEKLSKKASQKLPKGWSQQAKNLKEKLAKQKNINIQEFCKKTKS